MASKMMRELVPQVWADAMSMSSTRLYDHAQNGYSGVATSGDYGKRNTATGTFPAQSEPLLDPSVSGYYGGANAADAYTSLSIATINRPATKSWSKAFYSTVNSHTHFMNGHLKTNLQRSEQTQSLELRRDNQQSTDTDATNRTVMTMFGGFTKPGLSVAASIDPCPAVDDADHKTSMIAGREYMVTAVGTDSRFTLASHHAAVSSAHVLPTAYTGPARPASAGTCPSEF